MVYSNHGFAALGQIVQDVSGQPLDRFLRDHVFAPLGMDHTDLVRSARVAPRLATGYMLRARGLRPVADREVPTPGAGSVYSTPGDMVRYVVALLGDGSGEPGAVLKPGTLASMFEPSFQPDPRVPGMGLGFFLDREGGRRTIGHGGTLSGFLSQMAVAPDDGTGVVVLANTGGLDGRGAPEPLGSALLRGLLGLPDEAVRHDLPPRPETWGSLCGWYSPEPGPVTNLFARALMGAGAEVTVRRGHLMLRPLSPIPAIRSGLRLYPEDDSDPYVFRADLSELGWHGFRVVFSREPAGDTTLLMDLMAFRRRPDVRNPKPWATGILAAGASALAIRRRHQASA